MFCTFHYNNKRPRLENEIMTVTAVNVDAKFSWHFGMLLTPFSDADVELKMGTYQKFLTQNLLNALMRIYFINSFLSMPHNLCYMSKYNLDLHISQCILSILIHTLCIGPCSLDSPFRLLRCWSWNMSVKNARSRRYQGANTSKMSPKS